MPHRGLLHPEPLPLWQATADPYLRRRHSNTQRQVWLSLSGVSVLVRTKFCLSPPSIWVSLIAQLVKIRLQCRSHPFNSWVGKIHWRRDRLPTPVFFGFPCGSAGNESAYNVGDLGSIPELGRYPWRRKRLPLHYSGLENSMEHIDHGVTREEHWATFTFWTSCGGRCGMGFDSTVLLGLLLCPWTWGIFFSWDPAFSCWWLFSSEL